jgi:hypothetical protein
MRTWNTRKSDIYETERTTAITLKPPQADPTEKGKKERLFRVSILRTVAPNYSPQICSPPHPASPADMDF